MPGFGSPVHRAMRLRGRGRLLGGVVAVVALPMAGLTAIAPPSFAGLGVSCPAGWTVSGTVCSQTKAVGATAEVSTFEVTIPAGATGVSVTAAGAAGGAPTSGGKTPGQGAAVSATLNGDYGGKTLELFVGGAGSSTAGGWFGGGAPTATGAGGGGGGGSFVFDGATNELLVAAGGGGGATYFNSGGNASYWDTKGDLIAASAGSGGAYGGLGASQASGGLGGIGGLSGTGPAAYDPTNGLSFEGSGGGAVRGFLGGGGGGGGGYYGGGGGGGTSEGSGGGGASYVNPDLATWTASSLTSDASSITVSYTPFAPVAVTITADGHSKVFGDADPALTYTVTGLESGDSLTQVPTCTRAAGEDVGPYAITCSGATAASKYVISYVAGSLAITAKSGVVTADNKTITYGDPDPAFTYLVSGGGSVSVSCGVTGAHSAAGSYSITCIDSGNPNYSLSFTTGTLTVNPAPLQVTANNKTIAYGDPDPAFDATVVGLKSPDLLDPGLTCGVVGPHANAGTYPITCQGADGGPNYATPTYGAGTLTVTKATAVVSPNAQSMTYGDPDPALTYAVVGPPVGYVFDQAPTCSVGAHAAAGQYSITCSGGSDKNFTFDESATSQLTVGQRPITVTPNGQSIVYGQALPASYPYAVTSGSLVGSDAITGTCGVAGTPSAAGQYPITCAGLTAGPNYDLTVGAANLTIAKRSGAITPDAKTITYGDPDPTFTYTVSGGLSPVVTCGVDGTHSRAGQYVISCTAVVSDADQFVFNTASLTVLPAPWRVTVNNKTITVGDPSPAFDATISGLLPSDSVVMAPVCEVQGPHTAVGTYPITCSGADAGPNYGPPVYTAGTLAITKAASSGASGGSGNKPGDTGGLTPRPVGPAVVPGAPHGVVVVPGDGEATVSWNAPTGASRFTRYTVTASPSGATCTTVGVTHCVIRGLKNGLAYTFTVTASTGAGAIASAASPVVYPGSQSLADTGMPALVPPAALAGLLMIVVGGLLVGTGARRSTPKDAA